MANRRQSDMAAILSGEPNIAQQRPSTRVHQPSGGYSSNIFGTDPEPLKTAVAINPKRYESQISFNYENAPAPQATPRSSRHNQSQIFAQDPAPAFGGLAGDRPVSRRDPNYSRVDEQESVAPKAYGKKMFSGKSNESHFSLSNVFEDEVVDQRAPSARKNRNESRQVEEDPNYVKPSTRVLNPPGGRSNFFLG